MMASFSFILPQSRELWQNESTPSRFSGVTVRVAPMSTATTLIGCRIAHDIPRPRRIELQLKCTSAAVVLGRSIVYALKLKDYHDLIQGVSRASDLVSILFGLVGCAQSIIFGVKSVGRELEIRADR